MKTQRKRNSGTNERSSIKRMFWSLGGLGISEADGSLDLDHLCPASELVHTTVHVREPEQVYADLSAASRELE